MHRVTDVFTIKDERCEQGLLLMIKRSAGDALPASAQVGK